MRLLERHYKNTFPEVLITLTQKGNNRNCRVYTGMMEICGDVKRLLNEERVKRLVLFNLDEDKQE